ncbi:MAG: hypothetical protein OXB89_05275 [Anaerolineaceae bacterium]|nr:hypothetical protein [Anaerolineaceae bacterium]
MTVSDSDAGDTTAGISQDADAGDGSTRPVAALRQLFELALEPPSQPVAPGGRSSLRLVIRNDGDAPARYRLRLDGIPESWARYDSLTATIAPGASTLHYILLHPGRLPAFPPGEHNLVLRVEPTHAPQAAREQEFVLQLLPGSGFGMALEQEGNQLRLLLHNHGNTPLPIQLGALAPADVNAPELPAGPLTLTAGEQRSLPLRLRAGARPLFGGSRDIEFTIEANSLDEAGFVLALPARLRVSPRLERRLIPLILLLLAALALALFQSQPLVPSILDFSSNSRLLPRGEALILEWQVQDAATLQLEVNGQLRDLPPEMPTGGYRIETLNLGGDIALLLLAANGDHSVSQRLAVTVFEPMQVLDFSAAPASLLRHVDQTLSLRWDVRGAQQLRIEGPGQFARSGLEAGGALEGLSLQAGDALALNLVATDAYGNLLEHRLVVPAFTPTCTVSGDALDLYGEPQAAAQPLAQLEAGSQVAVDGRDPDGVWLHLPGESPGAWVQVDGLDCEGFAPADLRVLEPGRG